MSENSSNSKRIAKNTLMLYFRMLFLMGVSLYTSRVILANLGVEDYGIYNVVGGVVAMFTMISGSLSNAISRFINLELGKGNIDKLKRIFSTSVIIQIVLGLIIFILIDTIGLWFLNNRMTIPVERISAANWVLQFSAATLIVNLISIPYNASIIAHGHMGAFAYISILEAVGKLSIAYIISISPSDKLITYAALMFVVAIIVRYTYSQYCRRHFEECKFIFLFDKELFKEMFGFAGWNFFGTVAGVMRDQGGNILINIFCGPIVNAAKAVSVQVNNAIVGFSNNFMTALKPQITQSYASGNISYMTTLMFQGARISFYMLMILSLPVLVNTSYILTLWLRTVPEYTIMFVRLALIYAMVESLSTTLMTAILSTGNIKTYQITIGLIQLLNVPISYVFLYFGMHPYVILVVAIAVSIVSLMVRLLFLRYLIGIPVRKYVFNVFFNVLLVLTISIIIPFLLQRQLESTFMNFIVISGVCVISSFSAIYLLGCNKSEKQFINNKIAQVRSKILKR